MTGVRIDRWSSSGPPPLRSLVEAAEAEGLGFVHRTWTEWIDGSNRFDRAGEAFLLAVEDQATIGMCGLNIDPFTDDRSVGRIRHLYVLEDHRRRGVGSQLVEACLSLARPSFRTVRLRTADPEAGAFYAALGFSRTTEPEATHILDLRAAR